jgi:hypothetical protein
MNERMASWWPWPRHIRDVEGVNSPGRWPGYGCIGFQAPNGQDRTVAASIAFEMVTMAASLRFKGALDVASTMSANCGARQMAVR